MFILSPQQNAFKILRCFVCFKWYAAPKITVSVYQFTMVSSKTIASSLFQLSHHHKMMTTQSWGLSKMIGFSNRGGQQNSNLVVRNLVWIFGIQSKKVYNDLENNCCFALLLILIVTVTVQCLFHYCWKNIKRACG